MSGFIEWLESLSEKDTKVRAVLRRSLAFDPGTHVPAFPYVEPFVGNADSPLRRETLYLVAGLWAMQLRVGEKVSPMPIGKACAAYQNESKSKNTERRFIALLDADRDQLPHRLRQMISLLKEQTIDFDSLLSGLLYWDDDRKRTQNAWARDFYQNLNHETETVNQTEMETNK